MRTKINKSKWVILSSVLLFLISCATPPNTPPKQLSYMPEEEVRVNLGRIGIVSACFQPEVRFQKPMTKWAAAWRRGSQAAFDILPTNPGDDPGMAGIILIPMAAGALVVGSIYGAVEGIPAKKIKETEDALNSYLATHNFQETMRERFLSVARERTQFHLVLIEEQGPKALDEEITYGSLSDKDIDTILEISVRKCDLYDLYGWTGGIDPLLHLRMAIGTRLIQIKDGKVLYNRNFVYESWGDFHKFSEWVANNAQAFSEEVDRAFQSLAIQVVEALSNIQTPPLKPKFWDYM